jgi:uridine kinase
MNTITVTIEGQEPRQIPEGTEVGALLAQPRSDDGLPYLAALVNNDLASLSYPLTVNSTVRFLTMADEHGWGVYRRSLCFLLAKAVRDAYPAAAFSV